MKNHNLYPFLSFLSSALISVPLFPSLSLSLSLSLLHLFSFFNFQSCIVTDITGELDFKFQRALNLCVRYIFLIKWDERLFPHFRDLKWLKIKVRRLYFVRCLTFSTFSFQAYFKPLHLDFEFFQEE